MNTHPGRPGPAPRQAASGTWCYQLVSRSAVALIL
jgi:hypothetical protein